MTNSLDLRTFSISQGKKIQQEEVEMQHPLTNPVSTQTLTSFTVLTPADNNKSYILNGGSVQLPALNDGEGPIDGMEGLKFRFRGLASDLVVDYFGGFNSAQGSDGVGDEILVYKDKDILVESVLVAGGAELTWLVSDLSPISPAIIQWSV